MKKIFIVGTLLFLLCKNLNATIVSQTYYNGQTYYVDVLGSYNGNATVWLRINPNVCSQYDVQALQMQGTSTNFNNAANAICRAKNYYDNGKTILGCLSTAASGACLAASVPTGGAAAAFCSANFVYTMNSGLADCIDGVSNAIANHLGAGPWAQVAINTQLSSGSWSSVINAAIDQACNDLRASSQNNQQSNYYPQNNNQQNNYQYNNPNNNQQNYPQNYQYNNQNQNNNNNNNNQQRQYKRRRVTNGGFF